VRNKLAMLVAVVLVPVLGATACGGGVQEQVEKQVEEQVDQGRTQVEEQVQQQVNEARKQVEGAVGGEKQEEQP